jgi:hypothetical protein
MRTDHSTQITRMRALKAVDYTAAADLLELHDSTSLNLYEAPGLLAFVENRLKSLPDIDARVTPNFV